MTSHFNIREIRRTGSLVSFKSEKQMTVNEECGEK